MPLLSFVGWNMFHQFRSLKLQCLTWWGGFGDLDSCGLKGKTRRIKGQKLQSSIFNSFPHQGMMALIVRGMALQSLKPGLLGPKSARCRRRCIHRSGKASPAEAARVGNQQVFATGSPW